MASNPYSTVDQFTNPGTALGGGKSPTSFGGLASNLLNPASSMRALSPDVPPPGTANIQAPTTAGQIQYAQDASNNSLEAQNRLLATLQAQNPYGFAGQGQAQANQQGLANQLGGVGGAGNMVAANTAQNNLNAQFQGANGIGIQTGAVGGLQGLSNQYGQIAAGGGPNPAQMMLNQQTGANVANQAAMMAGQRGAGANVGLMARQAAMQGAGIQQQAVGQAATMQANQQLAAMGQQAGIQQAIGGIGSTLTGQQQAGVNAQAGQAQAQVAAQQAAQQQAAAQANAIAAQQIGAQQTSLQGNLANVGQQQSALNAYNSNLTAGQASINAANSPLANTKQQQQGQILGGIMSGAGAAGMAAMAAAKGGEVHGYDQGGAVFNPDASQPNMSVGSPQGPAFNPGAEPNMSVGTPEPAPANQPIAGPMSSFGKFLEGFYNSKGAAELGIGSDGGGSGSSDNALYQGAKDLTGALMGAQKSAPKSPASQSQASGGMIARNGGAVAANGPSQRAVVKGDSYANDKIPAKLSEGEFVIPRQLMESKDPKTQAAITLIRHLTAANTKRSA